MRNAGYLGTRWLGVGLAAVLAVVTLGLAVTGRLALYINPESSWFAVTMAIVVLIGAALSFAVPLGAEADHGHDHGSHDHTGARFVSPSARSTTGPQQAVVERHFDSRSALAQCGSARDETPAHHATGPQHTVVERAQRDETPGHHAETAASASEIRTIARKSEDQRPIIRLSADSPNFGRAARTTATVAGGVAASGVVLLTLVLPPASLSAELAMSRDVGAPPLFAGADAVTLASTGDTSSFGVGEWASVFATATNPDAFDGDAVTLTGFVTPSDGARSGFDLTRLVITHCVIDAQPASVPVAASGTAPGTGQWVTITGTVSSTPDGRLEIDATSVEAIAEPGDPYEY